MTTFITQFLELLLIELSFKSNIIKLYEMQLILDTQLCDTQLNYLQFIFKNKAIIIIIIAREINALHNTLLYALPYP